MRIHIGSVIHPGQALNQEPYRAPKAQAQAQAHSSPSPGQPFHFDSTPIYVLSEEEYLFYSHEQSQQACKAQRLP